MTGRDACFHRQPTTWPKPIRRREWGRSAIVRQQPRRVCTGRRCSHWSQWISPSSCDPWLSGWLPPSARTIGQCRCSPWPGRNEGNPWWSRCRLAHRPSCRIASLHSSSHFVSWRASCGPRSLGSARRHRQCPRVAHCHGRRDC